MATINRACSQRWDDQTSRLDWLDKSGRRLQHPSYDILWLAFDLGMGTSFTEEPIYPGWLFTDIFVSTTTHDTKCIANGVNDLLLATRGRAVIYVELGKSGVIKKWGGIVYV